MCTFSSRRIELLNEDDDDDDDWRWWWWWRWWWCVFSVEIVAGLCRYVLPPLSIEWPLTLSIWCGLCPGPLRLGPACHQVRPCGGRLAQTKWSWPSRRSGDKWRFFLNVRAVVKVDNERWSSGLRASERFYEIGGVGALAVTSRRCRNCVALRPMALWPLTLDQRRVFYFFCYEFLVDSRRFYASNS